MGFRQCQNGFILLFSRIFEPVFTENMSVLWLFGIQKSDSIQPGILFTENLTFSWIFVPVFTENMSVSWIFRDSDFRLDSSRYFHAFLCLDQIVFFLFSRKICHFREFSGFRQPQIGFVLVFHGSSDIFNLQKSFALENFGLQCGIRFLATFLIDSMVWNLKSKWFC